MTNEKRQAEAKQGATKEQRREEDSNAKIVRHLSATAPREAPPIPVSPHLLTWWFGLMALGGIGLGVYADRRPFGGGLFGHPLIIFTAITAACLFSLSGLHQRPLTRLISLPNLIAGAVIAVLCFLLGRWFGPNLTGMP